jgi:acetyl esterase/lipase
MKRLFLSLSLILILFGGARAQQVINLNLWPNGLPNSNGTEQLVPDDQKGIYTPSIRAFLPDPAKATGRAVVACPGGGYSMLAYGHEGYDWASFFNQRGIAFIVLKYRMPKVGHYEVPFSDAREAIRLVHEHAAEWHINSNDIGIMGSSAGGHLAATMATHNEGALRPAFQILFYPVITMDPGYTHAGSLYNLLGKNPSQELIKKYSNEWQINDSTPRAFMALSDDDDVVPPTNSVNYYTALRHHYIPASMYIYPSGGHGWGSRPNFKYHQQMEADLSAWLESFGAIKQGAIRVACIGNSITHGYGIADWVHHSYPADLERFLGDGYDVRNYGVSGRTLLNKGDYPYTTEKLYRDALTFNPNIVIIKLGTNDTKPQNWKYNKEFIKDLEALVKSFKNLPAKPRIYLCSPITVQPEAVKTKWGINDSTLVAGVIPMVRKVVKMEKTDYIDLHTPTATHDDEYVSDGVHPNEKGAMHLAKIISERIKNGK